MINHVKLRLLPIPADMAHRTADPRHTAGNADALKSGAGSNGTAQKTVFSAESHFSVGPDIQKEGFLSAAAESRSEKPGRDVAPDISRDTRRVSDSFLTRFISCKEDRGLKGGHRNPGRRDAGVKMLHDGIARDKHCFKVCRFYAEAPDESTDLVLDDTLQFLQSVRMLHAVLAAGDNVSSK